VKLYAPSLLLFEVANSIWKNPNVLSKTARSLVRLAVRVSPTLLNPQEEVAEQALLLARRTKLTFYDSIYLSLAKSLSLLLITADREQLVAADKYTKAVHLSTIEELKPSMKTFTE
jgi:predicted nucleic acid-binding protein